MPAHSLAPWIKFREDMWFEPGKYRGCRRRVTPVTQHVTHWTAGRANRQASAVYTTLKNRKDNKGKPSPLSITFVIDGMGDTWQMADAEKTVCYHAGAVNEFAVGTEIMLRGLWPALAGDFTDFEKVTHLVHGRMVAQTKFLEKQLEAHARLCDLLHEKLGIPKQVPGNALGGILTEVMLPRQRQDFTGFLEHLHVSSKKLDSGTQTSQDLVKRGYLIVEP